MPTPTMADTLDHVVNALKIIVPVITPFVGLAGYTWKKQDKSIDVLYDALKEHIESDEDIHKDLYDKVNSTGTKLAGLIGEHNGIHNKRREDHEKSIEP